MNPSPTSRFPLALALLAMFAAARAGMLHAATTATTDPQGFVALSAPGNADSTLSAPLARAPRHVDTVAAVSGARVTLVGAPGWTRNQLVHNGTTQPETFYLAFDDGAKAGQYFTITANGQATVTLDLAGDTLDAVQPGDTVRVVPYWTFGTLFPGGSGVVGTAVHSTRPTEILVYDHATAGINLSPACTYYYYTGTNPGWRCVGAGLGTVRDNDAIPPDAYLIYRQNTATSLRPVVLGVAPVAPVGTIVSTLQGGVAQDNHLAVGLPVPLTLAQLNLVESGAFAGSDSHGSRRDELFVFDNTVAGFNKSPAATYYYFTGTNPGWRRVGGGLGTVRNNEVVLQPGQGFIVRKAATAAPQSHTFSVTPNYQ